MVLETGKSKSMSLTSGKDLMLYGRRAKVHVQNKDRRNP